MKADAKTAIETANTAIETAKGISSAIDNFCGNSGTCQVLGLPDYQTPDYFDFDSEDYKWEIDAVDLADLGIDGSLPELSSGKTLDEIQALTLTLTLALALTLTLTLATHHSPLHRHPNPNP
eukprot:scaffold12783_cov60-Phaeocystis_antarctica.AAC.2